MKFLLKVLAFSLLGMLLVCAIKNCLSPYLPNENRGICGAAEMRGIKHLFIGSSMFRQGLDISVLAEELSEDSFILAYNGNQPVLIKRELECLKKRGVKIENLYLDMYLFSAASAPSLSDARILWDLDLPLKIEMFKDLVPFEKNKIVYAYSFFVSSNIQYLLSYPVSNFFIKNLYRKGGKNGVSKGGGLKEASAKSVKIDFFERVRKTFNESQKKALLEIIDTCKSQNINLVFVDTIKFGVIYNTPKYAALMKEYEDFLDSSGVEYVRFKDAHSADFANDLNNFIDAVHLSDDGCRLFTKKLCRELKRMQK